MPFGYFVPFMWTSQMHGLDIGPRPIRLTATESQLAIVYCTVLAEQKAAVR